MLLIAAGTLLVPLLLAGAGVGARSSAAAGTIFVAPPSSANLSTNGSDSDGANCTRFGTAITTPPAGVGYGCTSFQKAYELAQPGDTVYLNWNGPWVGNQRIGTSSNKSSANPCSSPTAASGCVNFTPAVGLTPSLTGGIGICADYIELSGIVFNQSTFTDSAGTTVSNGTWRIGSGDSSCQPSGSPPHDIVIENVEAHGPADITGGAYNVYVHGGSIGNSYNLPVQFGGAGNNGQTTGVHNSTFDGVTFHDFVSTNLQRYHMECIHMDFAGDSNSIRNSRFEGCPIYSIRVEAEGDPTKNAATQTNNLFENNFFDGQQLNFDCHDNGCRLTGNIVRFNTLVSGFTPTNDCALKTGNTCTDQNNVFYGNLDMSGCPSNGAVYGIGWTTAYNVFGGGGGGGGTICATDGTSAYRRTLKLRSPGPPTYDDHLANCSQLSASFVPPDVEGGHPATDLDGDVLPSRGLAGAGADQCDTSVLVFGRSIGAVKLGQGEPDMTAHYGPPYAARTVVLGKLRVRRFLYRSHRGYLWLYENANGTVVGIGTSSPYYSTIGGIGVGGPVGLAVSRSHLTWLQCRSAYTRTSGSTTVYVVPRGGRKGALIASISMVGARYAPC